MSFDYNTSRKHLVLPEYGRNIQKMVDHIKTIDDREERNRLAHSIVAIMGNLNPHLRDINDFKHKLWDHIAIISNFELDIDFPYEVPKPEMFMAPPRNVPYGTSRIRFRHYGKSIEKMVDAACEMEDGADKVRLITTIGNHMKKSYLIWNRDAVTDEVILNDLRRISRDRLSTEGIKLNEIREQPQSMNKRKNHRRSSRRHK